MGLPVWAQILAAVVSTLVTLGGGLKWFLTWLFRELEKREAENAKNQAAFLGALKEIREECAEEREQLQARADEQRERRLEDQRKHIETMHSLADTLTSRARSSTRPDSR